MTAASALPHRLHAWSPDVVLFPVAELDLTVRSTLGLTEGEFVLNLLGKGQGSQILNREAASLLALFRTPSTATEAIEALARAEGQPVRKRSHPRNGFDRALAAARGARRSRGAKR